MDLVMSHVNQKESIKITIQEAEILPKNVPIVDQYLNNYRLHKANGTMKVVSRQFSNAGMSSDSKEIQNANSHQILAINDIYVVNSRGYTNIH